jgi:hypothetical protein
MTTANTVPPTEGQVTAYVDESMRPGPGGLYLLAAVLVVPQEMGRAREAAQGLLSPRQPRFHWHSETELQRRRMLERVAELGCVVLGYMCPAVTRRNDRPRALCLNRMLWDLRERGVHELVIESRQEHNDSKDRLTIMRAKKAGAAPAALTSAFARPVEEPLLWLADAMAGAIRAQHVGGRPDYLDPFPPGQVTVVTVTP